MKTLILACGMVARLGAESKLISKPLVEIGVYPILWHIMKIYNHYSDMTIDLAKNDVQVRKLRSRGRYCIWNFADF